MTLLTIQFLLAFVYYVLLCMLIRESLSVPTTAVRQARNLTTKPLPPHPFTSSLDLISPRNITSSLQGYDLAYRVPNTQITMFFQLGYRIDAVALHDTIDAGRKYCDLQIEMSGDVPLPRTEDPFDDDLGYGAAVYVVSTNIHHHLTWRILRGVMQGLWDFLVEGSRYLEAEFIVWYAGIGIVGRGTITEADRAPDLQR